MPLARQRFIDGNTTGAGAGLATAPYATIAAFMTARAPTSADDANANFVGWVMPTLLGYVADVDFPAYASTELRADSFAIIPGSGVFVTGNVTWVNVAGAFVPTTGAVAAMHNISVSGDVTVTDDAGAPFSAFTYSADETSTGAIIGGSLNANTTTHLSQVALFNVGIAGNVNLGSAVDSAILVVNGCTCSGSVIANAMSISDSVLVGSVFTVNASGQAVFRDCTFQPGANPVLTAASAAGAIFDGKSWQSFLGAGGSRSAGTSVLVAGGYNAGIVNGAALTGASTDVSLDGTSATAGFTGENSGNHYTCASPTPTTVSLKTGGALKGDTLLITKSNLGANALAVKDSTGVTLGTIPANSRGFVLAEFSGSEWVFSEGGSLAA